MTAVCGHPVSYGGICASFQSIGTVSEIRPEPRENIRRALKHNNMLLDDNNLTQGGSKEALTVIILPTYFVGSFESPPRLVDDYRVGGYNYAMAERMLNESVDPHNLQE